MNEPLEQINSNDSSVFTSVAITSLGFLKPFYYIHSFDTHLTSCSVNTLGNYYQPRSQRPASIQLPVAVLMFDR